MGYASHLLTFVACPYVSLVDIFSARGGPDDVQRLHSRQDFAVWGGTQLSSAGLNALTKHSSRRQRPCWHFGRESETEAADKPWQQWVSFYSGDTAMAWSFVAAAAALAAARGREWQPLWQRGALLAAVPPTSDCPAT
jgi:hypothetical protein